MHHRITMKPISWINGFSSFTTRVRMMRMVTAVDTHLLYRAHRCLLIREKHVVLLVAVRFDTHTRCVANKNIPQNLLEYATLQTVKEH